MKQKLALIGAVLLLLLVGCTRIPDDRSVFQATVVELYETSCLVEPAEGSWEAQSADRIVVPTDEAFAADAAVGDLVEITHSGDLMESYPAQLGQVYGIKIIEKSK